MKNSKTGRKLFKANNFLSYFMEKFKNNYYFI